MFTPTPEGSIPSPDAILAQLDPEPGEPASGYITPDDIRTAWQAFLSRLHHMGVNGRAVVEQIVGGPVSPWLTGSFYPAGVVVSHDGSLWVSASDSPGEPGVDPAWGRVSLLAGGGTGVPGPQGPPGPAGPAGPPGVGVTLKGSVPTSADLPTGSNQPGDAYLASDTGDLHVWDGTSWHDVGKITGPQGPPGPTGSIDDLSDVDVAAATPGMLLQRQPGGVWSGTSFDRPLNWLSDVSTGTIDADGNPVPPAQTPPGHVLGTSAEGFWEPLSLAYLEEQIVAPLQAEIGDPHVVAAHTDLVGFISEIDQRVSAIEVSPAVAAERHLFVDKYSGSFIRVMVVPPTGPWPALVDFALATVPGVNGVVYPDLGSVAGGAAVYADFAGTLGRLYMADDTGVYGSTLKEWIRKGTVATVHRDDTDPAHPKLVVERVDQPRDAGTSLALNSLSDVTAPGNTPAGKVLGTTAEGAWGPVDAPSGTAALDSLFPGWTPYDPTATYQQGDYVLNDGLFWVAGETITPGDSQPPTVENGGDWFWGPQTIPSMIEFSDSVSDRVTANNLAVTQARVVADRALPVDAGSRVLGWRPGDLYSPGSVVLVYDSEGNPQYYSSDIEQMGGEAPSSTNMATWTRLDAWGLLNMPALFLRSLGELRDVTAPDSTPAGKVLGTTATGQWGAVDQPLPGARRRAPITVPAGTEIGATDDDWGFTGPDDDFAWVRMEVTYRPGGTSGGQGWLPWPHGVYVIWASNTDAPSEEDMRWFWVDTAGGGTDPNGATIAPGQALVTAAQVLGAAPWMGGASGVKTGVMAFDAAGTKMDGWHLLSAVTLPPYEQNPLWFGTQAEYDAIAYKQPTTLYVIHG